MLLTILVIVIVVVRKRRHGDSVGSYSSHIGLATADAVYSRYGTVMSAKGVGFSCDQNSRFRTTMEVLVKLSNLVPKDEHVIVERFNGTSNLGFFGVYDGHGGRNAAVFVKENLHQVTTVEFLMNCQEFAEEAGQKLPNCKYGRNVEIGL